MLVKVDSAESSMKTATEEQDVNEATAALKGLLGLGVQSSDIFQPVSPRTETVEPAVTVTNQPDGGASKSKKKKSKSKKKNSATGSNTTSDNNRATPKTKQPHDTNTTSKKKTSTNKTKNTTGNNKTKESENYAWSAFQSSPDASKLPMPAFPSAVSAESKVQETEIDREEAEEDTASIGDGELVEANYSIESNVGNSRLPPHVDEKSDDAEPPVKEPVIKTGVNLAEALAATLPPSVPQPQPHQYPVQHQVPYGNTPVYNRYQYPSPQFHAPHHHLQPMQHHHLQHQHLHIPHQQQPPSPYSTPPGYVTIHVTVPHNLMPGRQMMVSNPAGYPVHVPVPEGVPPGAIIPVHVPMGAPLHMMPPPPQPSARFASGNNDGNGNINNINEMYSIPPPPRHPGH